MSLVGFCLVVDGVGDDVQERPNISVIKVEFHLLAGWDIGFRRLLSYNTVIAQPARIQGDDGHGSTTMPLSGTPFLYL
ncbi:hypothetical protein E2C01_053826 [Portunus trituberculatus]|uniref:Uncharacterized protein n=1 Tax=Portunus trituberculatus TaxID=210409 RepID=A0A5B7GRV5_PORTR|nr:hypothetical protein [Portunus trituberculatus]